MRLVYYDFQAESCGWLSKSPHTGTADILRWPATCRTVYYYYYYYCCWPLARSRGSETEQSVKRLRRLLIRCSLCWGRRPHSPAAQGYGQVLKRKKNCFPGILCDGRGASANILYTTWMALSFHADSMAGSICQIGVLGYFVLCQLFLNLGRYYSRGSKNSIRGSWRACMAIPPISNVWTQNKGLCNA